jgi:hypothetical protein
MSNNKTLNITAKQVKKPKVLGNFTFDESNVLKRENIKQIFAASCKICKGEIKGSIKVPSNFHKHLRTHGNFDSSDDISEQPKISFSGAEATTKVPKNSAEQVVFEEALANLVGDCMLPLEFVESDGFKLYMNKMHKKFHPISRFKLRNGLIPRIFEKNLFKIKQLITEQATINITMDLWTDKRQRGFIAFNAHFIDKSWQSRCVLLEIKRFKGK